MAVRSVLASTLATAIWSGLATCPAAAQDDQQKQAPPVNAGAGQAQNPPADPAPVVPNNAVAAAQPGPGPDPIPAYELQPLPTVPVKRGKPGFNWITVDASALPKDREGIWVVDFAYKPVRLIEVEVEGKRHRYYYLYYRITNHTGKPRRLVPQFTLITDDGRRHEGAVVPAAINKIRAKEDPTIPLLGEVQVMGEMPASTREGIDEALYGVAIWNEIDHKADAFQIVIRGLSDAYQEVTPPQGGKPFTRYKALRLDFYRPGDERAPHPDEIRLGDPPYEWTYYP